MPSQILHGFDIISILSFLLAYQLAFDTERIHEGASIWLLHVFKNLLAVTALNACFALKSKLRELQEEGTVTPYGVAVYFFHDTYTPDDIIGETDADMSR